MADLVVLGFDREETVDEVGRVVERLVGEHLLELEDYVAVVRGMDGKVRINQAFNTTAAGALGGAFWGMLIGFLFLVPILGTAMGALSGAIAGKLTDIGIDDDTARQIGETLQPGTSALFLLVRRATTDRVIDELQPYNPKVIRTSLSYDDEEELAQALAQGPQSE